MNTKHVHVDINDSETILMPHFAGTCTCLNMVPEVFIFCKRNSDNSLRLRQVESWYCGSSVILFYSIWYFHDVSYIIYFSMLRRTRKQVVVQISETVVVIDLFYLCFTKTIFMEA